MRQFRSTLVVLMSLMAAPVYAQDVQTGIEAFDRGDYAAALREWRLLAERGDDDAQASLGLMYARGQGVPQDDAEAIKWFWRSAGQGNALAQNNLGVMYRMGRGVPQDYRLAVIMFRLSAAQGYALAQAGLGAMYQNGEGTRRDPETAYMWYTLAAEQGHQRANQARLALGQHMSVDQRWNALARAQDRQAPDYVTGHAQRFSPVNNGPSAKAPAEPSAPTIELAAKSPAPPTAANPSPSASRATWRVQLSALRGLTDAEAAWKKLQRANADLLRGMTLHVQEATLSKGTFYRVQAGPLADRATAVSLCNSLKTRDQDCFVVVP